MKSKFAGLLAFAVSASGLPLQVWAAVPTEVTDAISTTKADAATVAGLMLGVIVGLLAFTYMRRQIH